MCAAIHNNQNWSSANTTVHFNEEENVSVVRLHGNKIAEVTDDTMTIFDGGYQSNTTKSRLNALCTEFCVDGEKVFQKDFQWYVRLFVGAINGKNVYKNETFTNGYTFAQSLSNTHMTETLFSNLYNFVETMNPDQEMCLDFCDSQGITITDDVFTTIDDLLWNKENS